MEERDIRFAVCITVVPENVWGEDVPSISHNLTVLVVVLDVPVLVLYLYSTIILSK